jgi:hypothetical protein
MERHSGRIRNESKLEIKQGSNKKKKEVEKSEEKRREKDYYKNK